MTILNLDKPLAVFDIESTGTNRKADRIIDLAILIILPDGNQMRYTYRVHPGMPIPPESTAIHGITDADVKDAPPFEKIAPQLAQVLEGCDLAGYNLIHFDIPMLQEEFLRANVPFHVESRRILDAQKIFHKKEPRDLSAALRYYAGEEHTGAHGAMADVEATWKVIEGQFRMYDDLPDNMNEVHNYCWPKEPDWVDTLGRLKSQRGDVVINFGKFQGRSVKELCAREPRFIEWMLRGDFPRDTLDIIAAIRDGADPKKFLPAP